MTKEKEPSDRTDTSQSVFVSDVPDPQDTKSITQLIVTGLPNSPPNDSTRKSQLLHEGTNTDHQDLELPATHPNEGTHTSQLLPKGTPTDPKDSERNIQLTDMRLPSTMVTNLSGMTSSEVEPDTIPPIESLSDFKALMEDSEDDLNGSLFSDVLYAQIIKDYWAKHEEAAASYADLRAEIKEIHDQAYKAHENTDAHLRNYEKILLAFKSQHNTLYAQNDHLAIWVESSRMAMTLSGPYTVKY
ncbi:hypothetical protein Tco_0771469 [Tanacetum coccineum]|uniref:Uncharacterized protein n=1 Tax=Tanacetum coccineum TaxID=301880 RepID=A0ABQ4ZIW4_9ASTR